jgi:hypothetical protein
MCDLAAALNGQISSWTCTDNAPNNLSNWDGVEVSNGLVDIIWIDGSYKLSSGIMISFIFGKLTHTSFYISYW